MYNIKYLIFGNGAKDLLVAILIRLVGSQLHVLPRPYTDKLSRIDECGIFHLRDIKCFPLWSPT